MDKKRFKIEFWFKVFLAGGIFPLIVYPFMIFLARFYGPLFELSRHWWLPFAFGFWNIFYFFVVKECKKTCKDRVSRLLGHGALLGLILAIFLISKANLTGAAFWTRILITPILVGVEWRYATAYFNHIFNLKD